MLASFRIGVYYVLYLPMPTHLILLRDTVR